MAITISSPKTSSSAASSSSTRRNTISWLLSQALVALFVVSMLRNTASVSLKLALLSNLDLKFDSEYGSATVAQNDASNSTMKQRMGKRVVRWNVDDRTVFSQEFLFSTTRVKDTTSSTNVPFDPFRTFSFNSLPDKPKRNTTCIPMEDWHTYQYPSCNNVHEAFSQASDLNLVDWGSVSVVIKVKGDSSPFVIKGNKFKYFEDSEHALESRHKDASVQEHTSSSPFVASIHGLCGATVLAPLSDSGSLHDYVDSVRGGKGEELDALSKLKIAIHVSSGLAALHDLHSEPNATYTIAYAHNDLDVSQYILNDGIFQLNDFNLGKFIKKRRGDSDVKACFEDPHMAVALYRAPEDAAYLLARQGSRVKNEKLANAVKGKKRPFEYSKADVFSLGTIMYIMFVNKWMWESRDKHGSLLKLIQGERPPMPDKYVNITRNNIGSAAAAANAVMEAINMCWVHDPAQRASAYKVSAYLKRQLRIILRLPANKPIPLDTLRVTVPPIEDGPEDYDKFMMAW